MKRGLELTKVETEYIFDSLIALQESTSNAKRYAFDICAVLGFLISTRCFDNNKESWEDNDWK